MSAIAGCFPRTTFAPDGILTWDMVESLIRPKTYLYSQTGLVWLENTHNMAGGTVHPLESLDEICDRTHSLGLPIHLDGARIFNASVATGKSVAELSRKFDSVMFCLSKGLGAPVGSLLLGSRDFIQKAHVNRKMLGGAMRQAGILAAAGLIALEESPKLLRRDHENARFLAEGLARIKGITLDVNESRHQYRDLRRTRHRKNCRGNFPRAGETANLRQSDRKIFDSHGDALRRRSTRL